MRIQPGSKVRQIVKPIEGEVVDVRWHREAKKFEVLVEYKDDSGDTQSRWFFEDQCEDVEKPVEGEKGGSDA